MKKAAEEFSTLILNGEPEIGQVLDVVVSVNTSVVPDNIENTRNYDKHETLEFSLPTENIKKI